MSKLRLLQEDAMKWVNCPSSAIVEDMLKDDSIKKGDEVRAIAERILKLKINQLLDRRPDNYKEEIRKILENEYYTDDLEDKLDEVVNVAFDIIEADMLKGNTPIVIVDEEVDLSYWVKDTTVKVDIAIITKESLEIIAFDFNMDKLKGKAKLQEAELMALGVINDYLCLYEIKDINYTCVDVEKGNYYIGSITIDKLLNRGEEVKIAGSKALTGANEAVCGEYCNICLGCNVCSANNTENIKLLNSERFEPVLLTDAEILTVLNQSDAIKKWIEEINQFAVKVAVEGKKTWQGFEIVEGRVARKYKNEKLVKERLLEAGYKEEEITSTSLLSLPAMEKVIGKERLWELIGDLIQKPKGKTKLKKVG